MSQRKKESRFHSKRTVSMVDIHQVVGWLVRYNHSLNMEIMQDSDLTNLKLQNLLYYAQGHYLAERGEPLFRDDLMAWKCGPVVPTIYDRLKKTLESNRYDFIRFSVVEDQLYDPKDISKDCALFLETLMAYYNRYSPWGLRRMTQIERPWFNTSKGEVIRLDVLKHFFSQPTIRYHLHAYG